MRVDEVEAPTADRPPEVEAGLGVRALALTAVEGVHLDFYVEGTNVLDQVADEAAGRRIGFGRVHVGDTEHLHFGRLLGQTTAAVLLRSGRTTIGSSMTIQKASSRCGLVRMGPVRLFTTNTNQNDTAKKMR